MAVNPPVALIVMYPDDDNLDMGPHAPVVMPAAQLPIAA